MDRSRRSNSRLAWFEFLYSMTLLMPSGGASTPSTEPRSALQVARRFSDLNIPAAMGLNACSHCCGTGGGKVDDVRMQLVKATQDAADIERSRPGVSITKPPPIKLRRLRRRCPSQ